MAKKDQKQGFVPRKIDEFATEVAKGVVQVEGIADLVSLEDYLSNKEDQLHFLQTREAVLYSDVKQYIKNALPVRSGQWQEECRKLSWAYVSSSDQEKLKNLVRICPEMALLGPKDSPVTGHHLSHLIRAFLATIENLPPVNSGNTSCLVYPAKNLEDALQSKILCWEYLLSLRPAIPEGAPRPRRQTQMDLLLQQNEKILEMLATLLQKSEGKKSK